MIKTFFSDFFEIDKSIMKQYGAFDISLISDTPAFIDPFLLYCGKKDKYKTAHKGMIDYIIFLCNKADEAKDNPKIIEKYYYFKEPKQNWLGYVVYGNSGNGLKNQFAEELCINASDYINNFGHETITNSSHMEKLCLFNDGHGLDNVSDFTTCLIMPFLLDFTEQFSKKYLNANKCRNFIVKKAFFDYESEEWQSKQYYLPTFNNDYILLVPDDILVKGENFISRKDFIDHLKYSRISFDDVHFRDHINAYISDILNGEFTVSEFNTKVNSLIKNYPQLIDYYIKTKEKNYSEAISCNKELISEFGLLFNTNCNSLINLLQTKTSFYNYKDINDINIILKRLSDLKYVIEELGGNQFFHINNRGIETKLLEILLNRIWFAGNPKANNKRYVEYTLDFKTVFNSPVEDVIVNRYINNTKKDKLRILCYIYYTEREQTTLIQKANKYGLSNNKYFFAINSKTVA